MKYFVSRRYAALATCAFALLCPPLQHAVDAQNTSPTTPDVAAKAPQLSDAEARLTWRARDAVRRSSPQPSEKRAQAAEAAATLSAQIAWAAFDAKQWDDAATWFARRAEARRDAYENRRDVYEKLYQKLNQQLESGLKGTQSAWATLQKKYPQRYSAVRVALRQKQQLPEPIEFSGSMATQNTLIELGQRIRDDIKKANKADDKSRARNLSGQHQQLVALQLQMAQANMARSQRATLLSSLHILANDIARHSDLLRYAEWDFKIRQDDLSAFQVAKLPAATLQAQTAYLANATESLAGARENMALYDEAIATYQKALALRESLPANHVDRELNKPLFSLGNLYHRLGNLSQAREHYEQALAHLEKNAAARLAKAEKETNPQTRLLAVVLENINQIVLLNNLGTVVNEMGDLKSGSAYIERAKKQTESLPGQGMFGDFRKSLLSSTLGNLAVIQSANGDTSTALATFLRVIQMRREIGKDEDTAVALMNAAGVLWENDQVEQAKAYAEQARRLYAVSQDLRGVSAATNFLASIAREANQLETAVQLSEEALVIARTTGDLGWIASATRDLARTRRAQKRPDDAVKLLEEVSALDARIGAPFETQKTLDLQAQILEEKGQNEAALDKYKEAIKLLESVRGTARDQSTFGGRNYHVYDRIVKLLIKMDRGEEAINYLNSARAKQLHDKVNLENLAGNNPKLRQLFQEAGMLEKQQQAAQAQLKNEQARPENERDSTKVRRLRQIIAETPGEFQKKALEIRKVNSNFEQVMTLQPTQLRRFQPHIPDDTLLVQYAPLGDKLYIFVITNKELKIVTMPVAEETVWKSINRFRELMKTAQQDFEGGANLTVEDWAKQTSLAPLRDNLTSLYDILIEPIEEELASKKTLAFVPTQVLHYLPLQALAKKDGDKLRFLVEDKEIVYLAAADFFKVVQPRNAVQQGTGLMAIGNPAGADLPQAEVEAQNIAKLFSPHKVLSGAQATKTMVLEPDNLNKRIWHFATHGFLNAASPEQSYIQLAHSELPAGAQLSIGEVWGLDLSKVDLVTLSACQTALGDNAPTGTEITSLAESFSSAGAASVVASLWSVADDSTSALMSEFYKNLAAGQPKAQALQNAQRTLVQNPQYAHPFYWAPFILMGDWR